MAITLNGTTGITTPALDNQGNLTVDGGTIKLDGNYPVGTNNVALGDAALDSNVSGASNTAIGADALTANTASNNTAVGYKAGYANTTGAANTAVGQQALKGNAVGELNTAVGVDSLLVATGSRNTVVGVSAGSQITTGAKNTIIGTYSGNQGGLDIRTSSNNIVLSDGDGNPRVWNTGSYLACPTVYSFPVAGRDVYVDSNGTVGYLSSIRQSKTNIVDFTDASWLLNLSPKTFNYRTKDADNNYTDQAEGELYYGLIADEVEAVNSDLCFYNEVDGQQELAGVSYSKMITPMLKLIQEQQATITALTARITALEGN
jgi:trimeric autotransporter adhesin